MMLTRVRNVLTRKRDTLTERRRSAREVCDIPVQLFDAGGLACSAVVVDCSEHGVRVRCSEPGFPVRALYLLRLDTGAAYRLRCAWHGAQVAGYELKGRVDGRPDGREHALNALQTAWAELKACDSQGR